MVQIQVTTLADENNGDTNGTSLREAIQLANSNGNTGTEDVINFADNLAGGTITLTQGPLVITDDLRIDGDVLGNTTGKESGRADDITITTATVDNVASQIKVTPAGYTSPGQVTLEEAIGTFGDSRIFEVRENGTDAAFNALTMTGAGVFDPGRPQLPSYGASGAAIYQADFEAGTTGTLPDDTAFAQTWDEENSGLEPVVKTTVAVTNSEISNNYGGAVVAGHRFTMEDSILSGNHGGFASGIMITALEGEATLRDVHVVDHELMISLTTLGTGAPGAEFIIEDSMISNNRSVDTEVGGFLSFTGAGVFFSGSPGGGISITDSVVSDNQGILAGAIATGSPDQDITIKGSVFENNVARSDWLASFGGGAIALAAPGADVYVEGSSFVGNKNVANGGGAFAIGGTSNIFEIVNSTLTGNVSGKSGGAIGYQGTSNKTSLINSTVVDNHIVETPITDLNGLSPPTETALEDARGLFPELGSSGGLFNFLSYERFAFNGGDNQTRIVNSIIADNTNLGVASDVHFELGLGDGIDFLTDSGIRFDPNTGRKIILDPNPDRPPIVENYDLVVENSLIGAGIQSGNSFDIDQDGILNDLDDDLDGDGIADVDDPDIATALTFNFTDDGINPSTNFIGTPDAPIDPLLAPAALAGNGQTIFTPLPDSPVIDAGSNAFVVDVNTAPQGTVGGVLFRDIAGAFRIADGNGEGMARVDIGAVELETSGDFDDDETDPPTTPTTEAVYFAEDAHPLDVYQQTVNGVSLLFDGSDVLSFGEIDGIDVIASDQILLSFTNTTYVSGLGFVDDSDIVLFKATSWGNHTAGSFELYFDGSDVGLESIDGLALTGNGNLLLSASDDSSVDGVGMFGNEDVLIFSPTSLGADTTGSFNLLFDGSDVGLGDTDVSRDLDAIGLLDDGELLLSTAGEVAVGDVVATPDDVVSFAPTSLGVQTAGSFANVEGGAFSQLVVSSNLVGVDFGSFDHNLIG